MIRGRTPLITANNLALSFGAEPVFEKINVEISASEIFCIVGPNGSGKTTLIRVLLGLLKPDTGEVHRKEGLKVGYVPQVFAVDPTLPLTVSRLLRLTQNPSRKQMEASLGEVGAGDLLDCPVGTLSGGERQRVLLARALLRDPELLVLDEPIQNVDMAGQIDLHRLIMQIREERGCGVLMISHDLHLVMEFTQERLMEDFMIRTLLGLLKKPVFEAGVLAVHASAGRDPNRRVRAR